MGYLGENIPKLGFGLMRLAMKDGEIDLQLASQLVDRYMENGFTYFDTGYVYVQGKSEAAAKEILTKRYPREAFQFATKMPMWMLQQPSDMERIFEEQLERTGLAYFDFYLLHGLSSVVSDRFPSSNLSKSDEYDAWSFLKQIKAEGRAKHIGISFHDSAEVLDRLLTVHPEIEFVQLQINYADWEDKTVQSKACYETARKHSKPIIIMEPIKGGTLVNLRPEVERIFKQANPEASLASWALRFGASLDGIVTVLSGMSTMEQMDDNISTMKEIYPLSAGEHQVIEKAVKELHTIDTIGCTGCRYCTDDCPMSINIPKAMEILNDFRVYNDLDYSKRRYGNGMADGGKASDCIACGACEAHCPQQLAIIQHLMDAMDLFEAVV